MLSRSRSKDKGSNIPGPTYMNNEQVGNFLSNIRNNRPQRPNGSRPLPASPMGSLRSSRTFGSATPEPRDPPTLTPTKTQPPRSTSALSHRDMFSSSNNSRGSLRERLAPRAASSLGRPLVRDPFTRSTSRTSQKVDPATIERASSRTSTRSTSGEQRHAYRESGARWMERQEAASLRKALEDMDAAEEQRIFAAAQDEAAELVWKHQNPKAAIRSPDAPYEYTAHLKKGSHARAQSYDAPSPQSSASGRNSSLSSRGSSSSSVKVHDFVIAKKSDKLKSKKDIDAHPSKAMESPMQSPTKSHVSFDVPNPRRRSSGSKRKLSGSLFQNPNDKIYEEPEESASPPAEQKPTPPSPSKLPIHTRRNPFSRIQFGRDNLTRSNTDSQATPQKRFDRFEIHRNEPTQSRNPAYTSNENAPVTPTQARNPAASSPEESPVKMKDGKEIRADDIRAATSMRLKDRSPKLPTPSMVSDSPGRPIVSFQKDYKPKEVALKEEQAKAMVEMKSPEASHEPKSYPPSPPKSTSAPVVPTINMPDEPFGKKRSSAIPPIPEINVPDETPRPRSRGSAAAAPIPSISVGGAPSVPSINVSDTPSINVSGGSARPLPTINAPSSGSARPLPDPRSARNGRPLPRTANTAPSTMPKGHWTPSGGVRTSALCESCALPIAGRTVSAGGARFHPECFRCYHCSEALECVAFYPEPQGKREERLDRIYRRRNGEDVEIMEGYSENDDGDEGLRFYCHLDYHEFFSPRCKSCKTPIEGEVIVACGAEWHAGHFFCAECGDPFDSSTPFVEKDGYAWCVNCHTNRYSTKCKKCRKPVTDTVLKALGFEWHPNCFVCTECSGEFVDGRYFLRGEEKNPVCVKCEERRLKA